MARSRSLLELSPRPCLSLPFWRGYCVRLLASGGGDQNGYQRRAACRGLERPAVRRVTTGLGAES
jgi:hypothetical protein